MTVPSRERILAGISTRACCTPVLTGQFGRLLQAASGWMLDGRPSPFGAQHFRRNNAKIRTVIRRRIAAAFNGEVPIQSCPPPSRHLQQRVESSDFRIRHDWRRVNLLPRCGAVPRSVCCLVCIGLFSYENKRHNRVGAAARVTVVARLARRTETQDRIPQDRGFRITIATCLCLPPLSSLPCTRRFRGLRMENACSGYTRLINSFFQILWMSTSRCETTVSLSSSSVVETKRTAARSQSFHAARPYSGLKKCARHSSGPQACETAELHDD